MPKNGNNIKINTSNVEQVVSTLTSINNSIETDFDAIISAVSKINSFWYSNVSAKAISKFNKLKSDCKGSNGRKNVVNQYIKFLKSNVMSDYEKTEKNNTDFASLFK